MRLVAALCLILLQGTAIACGYCVEDKIAATYDHAVVTKALAEKHQVAFFHLEGGAPGGKIEAAAYAAGADRSSVRVSADALTLALAFDPRRVRLVELQARIEKRVAGASLMPLRVMERPGDFSRVARP
ncbi:MAG TPA: hypothetical protein VKE95_11685 [Burkholderiales bacterium]|nr:hypothetical protein [Burkholderiales bacterium]